MIVKLKIIEQLIEEFGFKFDGYRYKTKFNSMFWIISNSMLKYLGNKIEVEKMEDDPDYTHYDNKMGYCWHKLWFEPEFVPIEFINEDEFEI